MIIKNRYTSTIEYVNDSIVFRSTSSITGSRCDLQTHEVKDIRAVSGRINLSLTTQGNDG